MEAKSGCGSTALMAVGSSPAETAVAQSDMKMARVIRGVIEKLIFIETSYLGEFAGQGGIVGQGHVSSDQIANHFTAELA